MWYLFDGSKSIEWGRNNGNDISDAAVDANSTKQIHTMPHWIYVCVWIAPNEILFQKNIRFLFLH